ncbi:hypothetical protein EMPS_09421 [Entomortierella parvispora]|uniref:G domain-containing protein n=1 Tax=Entomortierella parvispora TaxID=205924 RepID=A0A9P3M0D4_9FUNG|nr:hypothetical protein EMPS_09421 [Entomortierella parvispora]
MEHTQFGNHALSHTPRNDNGQSPLPPLPNRKRTVPSSHPRKEPSSIIFVGNPGVGKSALLNALGGDFKSGYSDVGGLTTTTRSYRTEIKRHGRVLDLVDMPGVYETGEGKSVEFMKNLETLHTVLNNGDEHAIFFVISPRNGRIDNGDLALMKLVLDNIEQGPTVGLIITQVAQKHYPSVQDPDYTTAIHNRLKKAECKNAAMLDTAHNTLVLCMHREDLDKFEDFEVEWIENYVLSFTPRRMVVRDMVVSMVSSYFELLKRAF